MVYSEDQKKCFNFKKFLIFFQLNFKEFKRNILLTVSRLTFKLFKLFFLTASTFKLSIIDLIIILLLGFLWNNTWLILWAYIQR